jgi:hypothetical protein
VLAVLVTLKFTPSPTLKSGKLPSQLTVGEGVGSKVGDSEGKTLGVTVGDSVGPEVVG